jgi:hypothetical protein
MQKVVVYDRWRASPSIIDIVDECMGQEGFARILSIKRGAGMEGSRP